MNIVGLDLGKHKAQLCAIGDDGKILLERTMSLSRGELSAVFSKIGVCRVLVESSSSSEWVARHLEGMKVEVIVADPNFWPMYARANKKIKTDKRDARALAEALRAGAFRPAHRRNDDAWHARTTISVRQALVRSRTRMVNQVRSILDRDGWHVNAATPERFAVVVRELEIATAIKALVEPLLKQIEGLNASIADVSTEVERLAAANPDAARLDKVVGVGPITALAFVSSLESVERFATVSQVTSYLGLVPSVYDSGQTKGRMGGITKTGDTVVRTLLVEAAWTIWRSKRPEVAGLREWAQQVAERRGKMRAVTGLARRLARILFAIWRDGEDFDKRFSTAA